MLPIAIGAGAVMLLAAIFFISSSPGNKDAAKGDRHTTSGEHAPAPADPARTDTSKSTVVSSEPAAQAHTPEATETVEHVEVPQSPAAELNPEKAAEENLRKLLLWQGLPADDKPGRIKALEAYLERNGDAMAATRAKQMLADLQKDGADAEPPGTKPTATPPAKPVASKPPAPAKPAPPVKPDPARHVENAVPPDPAILAGLDNGLLAYWKMDETSGVTAADATGNGNTAALKGGCVWASGKIGGALSFNGTDGYADYGNKPGLNFAANAPFTYAAWIKTTDNFGLIFSQRNSAGDSPVLDIAVGYNGLDESPGCVMALLREDGAATGKHGNLVGGRISDGTWHHAALTRNAGGRIELFLDGASQGAGAGPAGAITTDLRTIGCERCWVLADARGADRQYLSATIDDARIYNRALTAAEIGVLASGNFPGAEKPGETKPPPSKLAAVPESVRKELAPHLQNCKFSFVLDTLDKKLADPALADAKEALTALRGDVAGVAALRQAAFESLRAMAGKTVTLKMGHGDVSGRVEDDPAKAGIVLKVAGGSEMRLAPEQLDAPDIDAFAPAAEGKVRAAGLRTRALMFCFTNDQKKSREYFKQAQEAGATNLEWLQEQLAGVEAEELEKTAQQAWNAAETQFKSKRWEAAQQAFLNFKTTYAKTKALASLQAQLRERLETIDLTLHPVESGLLATYFKGKLFKDEDVLTSRVDDNLNFDTEKGLPFPPNVPKQDFCARWLGLIKVDKPGHYTFTLLLDDGGRLWIDGRQLIDDWTAAGHAPLKRMGQIDLEAGYHEIKIDFFQGAAGAACKLFWALRDGFAEVLVPDDALWHRPKRKN